MTTNCSWILNRKSNSILFYTKIEVVSLEATSFFFSFFDTLCDEGVSTSAEVDSVLLSRNKSTKNSPLNGGMAHSGIFFLCYLRQSEIKDSSCRILQLIIYLSEPGWLSTLKLGSLRTMIFYKNPFLSKTITILRKSTFLAQNCSFAENITYRLAVLQKVQFFEHYTTDKK